ncbi:hypothetical protein FISHEDRAFT_68580 [Fistulina hepatica ATCC 64428]|uniref:Alcohol dehydrogenase-like C-terminal domain-containing protein n=1 Tax=Fistulina hepatica ATCC 64428 TaxID=1128425 RepID=A0A0D7API2_9AGAR|nr:hypothetical protein FISHEDRAFT_68580 [Fistulina hepatica ATCC 64428]
MGKNVAGFEIGDHCTANVSIIILGTNLFSSPCLSHPYVLCTVQQLLLLQMRKQPPAQKLLCMVCCKMVGFYKQYKLYKIKSMTDAEVMLLEPAAHVIHGLDKLYPLVDIKVLLLGADLTGLILTQVLNLNSAMCVVITANKGIKIDLAKQLDAANKYLKFDCQKSDAQCAQLKAEHTTLTSSSRRLASRRSQMRALTMTRPSFTGHRQRSLVMSSRSSLPNPIASECSTDIQQCSAASVVLTILTTIDIFIVNIPTEISPVIATDTVSEHEDCAVCGPLTQKKIVEGRLRW